MSAHPDTRATALRRNGSALLMALVTLLVMSLCLVALWQTTTGAARGDHLRTATARLDRQADSVLTRAVTAARAGHWRPLSTPGQSVAIYEITSRSSEQRATITRLGWSTLLVRGAASGPAGIPFVTARADHRLLIPLRPPLSMPLAALTGGQPWTVDPFATLSIHPTSTAELVCRAGGVAETTRVDTAWAPLDPTLVTLLDPDTVSAPLTGVFRLIRDRIRRPLVVSGIVESVTALQLGADLQLAGVLVVQGSVEAAGGRLDVTGAVITRDSGGGHSVLGNGDRVRYDACAIRRALERATRAAPAVTWTIVGHF